MSVIFHVSFMWSVNSFFFLSWTIPFLLSLFLLLFLKNEKEGSRVEDGTGWGLKRPKTLPANMRIIDLTLSQPAPWTQAGRPSGGSGGAVHLWSSPKWQPSSLCQLPAVRAVCGLWSTSFCVLSFLCEWQWWREPFLLENGDNLHIFSSYIFSCLIYSCQTLICCTTTSVSSDNLLFS